MTLQKVALMFFGSLITIGFILTCLIGYWLFLDTPIPVEISSPLPVDKAFYYLGDEMIITTEFCRYTDAVVNIHTTLVRDDGLRRPLPAQTYRGSDIGCHKNFVQVSLPNDLQEGRWRRETRAEYQVNWLAVRQIEWHTDWFLVKNIEGINDE